MYAQSLLVHCWRFLPTTKTPSAVTGIRAVTYATGAWVQSEAAYDMYYYRCIGRVVALIFHAGYKKPLRELQWLCLSLLEVPLMRKGDLFMGEVANLVAVQRISGRLLENKTFAEQDAL
jgi:hypothetical protein